MLPALICIGMKTGIIYKATNLINGKSYIGQTIRSLNTRRGDHLRLSHNPKQVQYNHLFHRAIRKYGIDNFRWEQLERCAVTDLNDREVFHIVFHNTYAPNGQCGYNMTKGGDTHFGSSGKYHYLNRMSRKEKRAWLQKYRIGTKNPNFGNSDAVSGENHFSRRMTPSEYQRWVDGISGGNNYQKRLTRKERRKKCWINKLSKTEREKWKKTLTGENNSFAKFVRNNPGVYKGKNNPLFGVPNESAKKEYIITLPTGDVFRIKGLRAFCKENQLNSGNMSCCANGTYKQVKGYRCRFFNPRLDKSIKWWYPTPSK